MPFGGYQQHQPPGSCRRPTGMGWARCVPMGHVLALLCTVPEQRGQRGAAGGPLLGECPGAWCSGLIPCHLSPVLPCSPLRKHTCTPKHSRVPKHICVHKHARMHAWLLAPARPSQQRAMVTGGVVRWRRRVPAQKGKPSRLCGWLVLTTSLLSCTWKSLADWQPRITSFSIPARSVGRGAI